jgi:hypothetical protein
VAGFSGKRDGEGGQARGKEMGRAFSPARRRVGILSDLGSMARGILGSLVLYCLVYPLDAMALRRASWKLLEGQELGPEKMLALVLLMCLKMLLLLGPAFIAGKTGRAAFGLRGLLCLPVMMGTFAVLSGLLGPAYGNDGIYCGIAFKPGDGVAALPLAAAAALFFAAGRLGRTFRVSRWQEAERARMQNSAVG